MKSKSDKIAQMLSIIIIVLLSFLTLTFFYMYVAESAGFLYKNRLLVNASATAVIAVLTAIAIIFQLNDKNFVFRLTMMVLLSACIIMAILYLLKMSGFWERVDSVQDLREFISSTGGFSVVVFIIIQILQVLFLPIPGVVSIGAGVALFGAFWGAVYSFIGIMIGSLLAFFIGRILGYKAAKWLVGDSLDKGIESVKGKDKIVLSFMFLFPFFPDDLLCFVAGISSMSTVYFLIMVTVTRLISVFFTAFSVNGNLIPYNTWWGITIWGGIFIVTVVLAIYLYKHGEKIEKFFAEKLKRK